MSPGLPGLAQSVLEATLISPGFAFIDCLDFYRCLLFF